MDSTDEFIVSIMDEIEESEAITTNKTKEQVEEVLKQSQAYYNDFVYNPYLSLG